jgi:hypothetical protein
MRNPVHARFGGDMKMTTYPNICAHIHASVKSTIYDVLLETCVLATSSAVCVREPRTMPQQTGVQLLSELADSICFSCLNYWPAV